MKFLFYFLVFISILSHYQYEVSVLFFNLYIISNRYQYEVFTLFSDFYIILNRY